MFWLRPLKIVAIIRVRERAVSSKFRNMAPANNSQKNWVNLWRQWVAGQVTSRILVKISSPQALPFSFAYEFFFFFFPCVSCCSVQMAAAHDLALGHERLSAATWLLVCSHSKRPVFGKKFHDFSLNFSIFQNPQIESAETVKTTLTPSWQILATLATLQPCTDSTANQNLKVICLWF